MSSASLLHLSVPTPATPPDTSPPLPEPSSPHATSPPPRPRPRHYSFAAARLFVAAVDAMDGGPSTSSLPPPRQLVCACWREPLCLCSPVRGAPRWRVGLRLRYGGVGSGCYLAQLRVCGPSRFWWGRVKGSQPAWHLMSITPPLTHAPGGCPSSSSSPAVSGLASTPCLHNLCMASGCLPLT